jgi:transcriptional regulator GlxA family with amidase domain
MAHQIALLALQDVVVFDLGVVTQIFGTARDGNGGRLYRARTCTPGGEPVRANHAARRSVVPPWRDGGQSQFVERPLPDLAARRRRPPAPRRWSVCTSRWASPGWPAGPA